MRRKYPNMNANAPPQSATPRMSIDGSGSSSPDARLGVEELAEQLHEALGLIAGYRVAGARDLDVARPRLRLHHRRRDLRAEDVRLRTAHEQRGAGDRAPRRPEVDRIAPPAASDKLPQTAVVLPREPAVGQRSQAVRGAVTQHRVRVAWIVRAHMRDSSSSVAKRSGAVAIRRPTRMRPSGAMSGPMSTTTRRLTRAECVPAYPWRVTV